jgi:hypothetical protein
MTTTRTNKITTMAAIDTAMTIIATVTMACLTARNTKMQHAYFRSLAAAPEIPPAHFNEITPRNYPEHT